jgi:hypothetical protein
MSEIIESLVGLDVGEVAVDKTGAGYKVTIDGVSFSGATIEVAAKAILKHLMSRAEAREKILERDYAAAKVKADKIRAVADMFLEAPLVF